LRYVAEYAKDLLQLLQDYQKFLPVAPADLQSELDTIDLEFLIQDLPKLLDSMKLGTDRIVEIVQSLKNFSRHDEAQMKAVNIHDGINGTLMILRHRLNDIGDSPSNQIYQMFQRNPISLKLYTTLLSQFYCPNPAHSSHKRNFV
jgi:signal transduction histidine kinase